MLKSYMFKYLKENNDEKKGTSRGKYFCLIIFPETRKYITSKKKEQEMGKRTN